MLCRPIYDLVFFTVIPCIHMGPGYNAIGLGLLLLHARFSCGSHCSSFYRLLYSKYAVVFNSSLLCYMYKTGLMQFNCVNALDFNSPNTLSV